MAEPWDPEHAVDRALAQRLVAATWPDLAGEPVHVGAGWDVDVWRFGDLAVRFPRRAAGAACLANELAVLPQVADRVPLPVPLPLRIGEPALGYPSRFYAHAYLAGTPLIRAGLDDTALAALAVPLGTFLRALHATMLPGLPHDPRGGVERVVERGLGRIDRVGLAPELAAHARALFEAPLPACDLPPVPIHGDCHAGNLLVAGGAIAGVIDWGDAAQGDPAWDLAVGWSIVPPAARPAFLAAYGPVAPTTWARARLGALSRQGIALLAWGEDSGAPEVAAWARASIARALADHVTTAPWCARSPS